MSAASHDPLAIASTATISDCLDRLNVMDARIQRLAGVRFQAPAFTVRTIAGESATVHRALTEAPAGSAVVVDGAGYVDRAIWGDILTLAALKRGVVAVVIDGAVRDIEAIRASGLSVFARGTSPAGPHKGWRGDWGSAISCGGVVVTPGDLVAGDDDGVVVIPAARIDDVRRALASRLEKEDEWRRRIAAGESSVEVLGIDAGPERGDR
jgi:regulator of RNase E activity RraA